MQRYDSTLLTGHLLGLADSSEQGFALFDESDTLRYANPAFRRALGLHDGEFPTWFELMRLGYARDRGTRVEADDFETWVASARSRRGKVPYRVIETNLHDDTKRDGERWVLTTETTHRDGWMLCVVTDVTALHADGRSVRQARDKALLTAMVDELTQLGNRRYIMKHLQDLLQSRAADAAPLAVALLDLDHFKSINDRFGHDVGDSVLCHFASVLKSGIRRDDLAGRYGGEEFAMILPGADRAGVAGVIARVLQEARNAKPVPDLPQLRYTCSVGIAFSRAGDDPRTLLHRADRALYQAKAEGRDQYRLAEDSLCDGLELLREA